ncbi:MAG: glycosyltransferase family 4 protein [Archaeoglobaceae archaeon]
MHIGIISEYFPQSEKIEIRGGAEARTFHIGKHLAKNHQITIITSREPVTEREDEVLGMKVFRVGKTRSYSQSGSLLQRASFIRQAIKVGKRQNLDVVEGTNFLSYPPAWKIGEHLDIPRVITYHDVWVSRWIKNIGIAGVFGEVLERYALSKKWNLIFANSNYTKSNLEKVGVKSSIVVVPNGVDLERYRSIWVEKFENPTICTISRLVKYKRLEDLIRAVGLIREDMPDVNLKIIGSGPEEDNLRELVKELGLEENVEFLGFVEGHDDVIRVLKASHVFALPSVVEGFGMVVIEALAAGIPYVASNISPVYEVTNGGVGGLLFEPMNHEDLAEKLKVVLRSSENLLDGLDGFIEEYDWGRIASEVERYYESLLRE